MKLSEFLQFSWRERFPSFGAPSPISRKLAQEERSLISSLIPTFTIVTVKALIERHSLMSYLKTVRFLRQKKTHNLFSPEMGENP
jgi:hypothetical protein